MSQNVYDILTERGFIEQCTHPEEVRELLGGKEPVTFYIGFDATADSLRTGGSAGRRGGGHGEVPA